MPKSVMSENADNYALLCKLQHPIQVPRPNQFEPNGKVVSGRMWPRDIFWLLAVDAWSSYHWLGERNVDAH